MPTPLLTDRQVEVLTLVAEGLTNRQVGRRLWLTEACIKTHLQHIGKRLGVPACRSRILVAAYRAGIIQ